MKIFRIFLTTTALYLLFAFFSTSFTGCAKTTTVHDTTIVTIKDTVTVTVKDTVTITDTLGNLSDGLIAYYNFNGGNLNDSSGNNNNIFFNNAVPTTDRFGIPNNAYLFNGSSSYMQVKNSASLNPNNITLFAIIKPLGFNYGQCHLNQIMGKLTQDPENGIYDLRFGDYYNSNACNGTAPDTTFEIFNGSFGDNLPQGSNATAGYNSNVIVQKNEWYTVAFTYDGTTAKMFIDGALTDSSLKTVSFTASTYDLFIGDTPNPPFPFYFNGVIDEIRIYNKAITNQQVGYLNILKDKYLKMNNKLIY
jgi:concanavalin A-like lectin/glucanase superfamily protein